ncbi:SpoIIE family protein phosphatase [Streptomyces lunaelactis]|uniref:SpoIIE family protein phosphatase n=2 Tax=Streptomyces lunaelactis TaxID=1535768 RepID=UPI001584F322|nr:SpoIIE family protein phosphatase [Streptomyces lunaelactis]NUK04926.1 SpoIIE family protein phosphatase [Streptomyces lunaelactis]NUK13732.1 SpoIIE family protein phosphatase [Streptomyces lunaelactis]NUK21627.1 SpoIIE family protein phosphatase [Streptomyces lunaelactis]NUK32374.1 SpoIIE family protein phosphatase [Streptomyces lunaelactis]NUK40474.1 SpoIIE family protein phosphatase [Streptomyces lunaelactis]
MDTTDGLEAGGGPTGAMLSAPSGLLDVLSVAAVVLDADGNIALWSPQAEQLFGWSAEEALGRPAAELLAAKEHVGLVLELFARVMGGDGDWAGAFPVRRKDGSSRLVEFRNMRLLDEKGDLYALGIATDRAMLRHLERDLALSSRLVAQSPIGLAVLDTNLHYVLVNPTLERINGLAASEHIGRRPLDALSFLDDAGAVESAMRQVLATGTPLLEQFTAGRTHADESTEHAWSVSYYRLEDATGRVLGVATSVVDVTESHQAAKEIAHGRRRLALIADASVRIGTTLDLDQTARELADVVVPELADVAAVDILDSVLEGRPSVVGAARGPAVFRALAVSAAYSSEAVRAADPPGDVARYDADRLVTQCATTGHPVLVAHVQARDLSRIARDDDAAALLARAGLRSYLAVPLIARGEVLGALDLKRTRNLLPFDADDIVLAGELAARAAVCIDNARWYRSARKAAIALQRHLLPQRPPQLVGLEVAYRYRPAAATIEIGGDWFDAIAQADGTTALVVGDVMGSGINAAATMGQLRTATRTLAELGLDPTQVLQHLDRITSGLGETIATCIYAVYDPRSAQCRIAVAGHLPPVLARPGEAPRLLDLPTGAPLGVGGIPFEATTVSMMVGDELVLYTDGLVETRDQPIDARLNILLELLANTGRPLEETCDWLLDSLRRPDDHDDVALVIARVSSP